MPQVRILGIDIAKQVFHVVGMDDTGNVLWRKRLPRAALMPSRRKGCRASVRGTYRP
jgi:hypothetical protein